MIRINRLSAAYRPRRRNFLSEREQSCSIMSSTVRMRDESVSKSSASSSFRLSRSIDCTASSAHLLALPAFTARRNEGRSGQAGT
jgi:hypothetical protein